MRRMIAIVVAILVGASCVPWLRHQPFFSVLLATTTVVLISLITYSVGRLILTRSLQAASEEKSESTRPFWLFRKPGRLLMLVPLFLVFLLVVPHFLATGSGVYKLAVEAAHNSLQFTEVLGSPVKEGWFSEGKSEWGDHAKSDIAIPVYGQKRKGILRASAIREGGSWRLEELALELTDTDVRIDLMSKQAGPR